MNTLAYFDTEEDYQAERYSAEVSIVQFVYNKKKNTLSYRINTRGCSIYVTDADRIVVRHLEDHFVRISVIGGKGYEEK